MIGGHWIFGYGSLMWKPGFDYLQRAHALVYGRHRKLCIYSHVHRGTPALPGLVLGLDTGGSCHGVAFRVAPDKWNETVAYLREREQVTGVYLERQVSLKLMNGDGTRLSALTYIADRNHHQYAGVLDDTRILEFVRQGHGIGGACREYVINTTRHLEEMGIHDAGLARIAMHLSR